MEHPKKIILESKLSEAAAYHSMGLYQESLDAYEQILLFPSLKAQIQDDVEKAINTLRQTIDTLDKGEEGKCISLSEIAFIKENIAHENLKEILNIAASFMELGVFDEALAQYEKLFEFDYSPAKIVSKLSFCLLRLYASNNIIIEKIDCIARKQGFKAQKQAQIRFMFGLAMEKQGHNALAVKLIRSANKFDPKNSKIKAKLNSLLVISPPKCSESAESFDQKNLPQEKILPDERTLPDEKILTQEEKRSSERIITQIPEFVFADFSFPSKSKNAKKYQLNVINYSKQGLGLLLNKDDFGLIDILQKGDTIKDVTFYASWAIIRGDVRVKHKTLIKYGEYEGKYIIGIESFEI